MRCEAFWWWRGVPRHRRGSDVRVVLIRSLSSSVAFFISHFRNDTVHRLPKVFNTSVSATSPLPTLTLTPITGFVFSLLSGFFLICLVSFRSFLLSFFRPNTLGIFGFAFQVSTRRAEKQNLSLPRKNASKQWNRDTSSARAKEEKRSIRSVEKSLDVFLFRSQRS